LLNRTSSYLPWLKYLVLIGGLAAALGLIFAGRVNRQLALGAAAVGLVASLAGPTAYTLSTVQTGHTGSIVTAGPAGASMMGGPGGGGMRGGFGGGGMPGRQGQQNGNGNTQNGNGFPGGGKIGRASSRENGYGMAG